MKKEIPIKSEGASNSAYGCSEYREEMILLSLRQRLLRTDLTEQERIKLLKEIERLEKAIGF